MAMLLTSGVVRASISPMATTQAIDRARLGDSRRTARATARPRATTPVNESFEMSRAAPNSRTPDPASTTSW
jgi:hypothetical protein